MTDAVQDPQVTDLEFSCPSCGADLSADETFLSWRVCSACGRHFSMPALARAQMVVDEGTFIPLREPSMVLELDDNMQTPAQDRLASVRERSVVQDAVVTGTGDLGGTPVVVIALDDQLIGAQIGVLGAEKVITALEHALSKHLPVVTIVAGGTSRMHSGPLSVVQGARIASMASQVQAQGIPMLGILTHPTSASVFNSIASLCDLIFAEPGASVGVVWSAQRPLDASLNAITEPELLANGWIDGILPRPEQHARLAAILALISRKTVDVAPVSTTIPTDLDSPLVDYLDVVVAPFTELRGDRVDSDDRGVVTGIGAIDEIPVAIAVQDARTESNTTGAIRKIQRLARFAGRFELPLVMIVDGPEQASPFTVTPDESFATAKLSAMMSVLPIPIISVGAGKIRGLVSSMMMFGDRLLMAESSNYMVANYGSTPFNTKSPLPDYRAVSARECMRMGLIDQVVEMPEGGVQADPWMAVRMLREEVRSTILDLSRLGPRRLIERRASAHRELGHTEEGLASVLGELRDWQDVQHSVSRSFDEWRERREHRQSRPAFQRPDLGEIGARLKARQERLKHELLERTGRLERTETEES